MSVGGWSSSFYSGFGFESWRVSAVKCRELVIGWRPRVNCGRVAHGGAILVFLNTVLGLGGLLELLEETSK